MKISVIGSGYVGLVSGACFTEFGHSVIYADLDDRKIEALNNGRIPIYEPGLEQIVTRNSAAGPLGFTTDVEDAVSKADVVFIAVPPPSRRGDGHADLSYVYAAAKTIAMLGLTFKPNTDDMRDAPSLFIIQALQDKGAIIKAYDPEGMEEAKHLLQDVTYCNSAYEAADGADAITIVTEWDVFRALDFPRLKDIMVQPVLVDLRNIYRQDSVETEGFKYRSIGRPQNSREETLP